MSFSSPSHGAHLAPTTLTLILSLASFFATLILLSLHPLPSQTCSPLALTTQTLLTVASFLFFSPLLSTIIQWQLLHSSYYPLTVSTERLNILLKLGTVVSWFGILAGLATLGTVLVTGHEGLKTAPTIGMSGIGLAIFTIMVLEFTSENSQGKEDKEVEKARKEWEERAPRSPATPGVMKTPITPIAISRSKEKRDIGKLKFIFVALVFVLEFIGLVVMLGIGSKTAIMDAHQITNSTACRQAADAAEEIIVIVELSSTGNATFVETGGLRGNITETRSVEETRTLTATEIGDWNTGGGSAETSVHATLTRTLSTTTTVVVNGTG